MLLLFHAYGCPGNHQHFVFNGDFVDRGAHQLEACQTSQIQTDSLKICSFGVVVERRTDSKAGATSVQVVGVLFALKLTFPSHVWLVRGNHEDTLMNRDLTSMSLQTHFIPFCLGMLPVGCL